MRVLVITTIWCDSNKESYFDLCLLILLYTICSISFCLTISNYNNRIPSRISKANVIAIHCINMAVVSQIFSYWLLIMIDTNKISIIRLEDRQVTLWYHSHKSLYWYINNNIDPVVKNNMIILYENITTKREKKNNK